MRDAKLLFYCIDTMSTSSSSTSDTLLTARNDPNSPTISTKYDNSLGNLVNSPLDEGLSSHNNRLFDRNSPIYDDDYTGMHQREEGELHLLESAKGLASTLHPVEQEPLGHFQMLYKTYFGFNGFVQLILAPFFQGLFYGLGEASAKVGIGYWFNIDPLISLCGLPFNSNKEEIYKVKRIANNL